MMKLKNAVATKRRRYKWQKCTRTIHIRSHEDPERSQKARRRQARTKRAMVSAKQNNPTVSRENQQRTNAETDRLNVTMQHTRGEAPKQRRDEQGSEKSNRSAGIKSSDQTRRKSSKRTAEEQASAMQKLQCNTGGYRGVQKRSENSWAVKVYICRQIADGEARKLPLGKALHFGCYNTAKEAAAQHDRSLEQILMDENLIQSRESARHVLPAAMFNFSSPVECDSALEQAAEETQASLLSGKALRKQCTNCNSLMPTRSRVCSRCYSALQQHSSYTGIRVKRLYSRSGVYTGRFRWQATCFNTFSKKLEYIGTFNTEEEAAAAHDRRSRELYGPNNRGLNFTNEQVALAEVERARRENAEYVDKQVTVRKRMDHSTGKREHLPSRCEVCDACMRGESCANWNMPSADRKRRRSQAARCGMCDGCLRGAQCLHAKQLAAHQRTKRKRMPSTEHDCQQDELSQLGLKDEEGSVGALLPPNYAPPGWTCDEAPYADISSPDAQLPVVPQLQRPHDTMDAVAPHTRQGNEAHRTTANASTSDQTDAKVEEARRYGKRLARDTEQEEHQRNRNASTVNDSTLCALPIPSTSMPIEEPACAWLSWEPIIARANERIRQHLQQPQNHRWLWRQGGASRRTKRRLKTSTHRRAQKQNARTANQQYQYQEQNDNARRNKRPLQRPKQQTPSLIDQILAY